MLPWELKPQRPRDATMDKSRKNYDGYKRGKIIW